MNFEKAKLISNIVFYVSVLYTLGVLLKTYLDRMNLPEGVCPLENNNVAIYIGIGLLILSLITSSAVSIVERKRKNSK